MFKNKLVVGLILVLSLSVLSQSGHAVTVYTPNGSPVTASVLSPELSAAAIAANDAWVATNYPNTTLLSSSTIKYNCHSYAFYQNNSSNPYWINDVSAYWLDGSYTQVIMNPVLGNDKFLYTQGASHEHSGIYTGILNVTISKWGQVGLISHNWYDTPYPSHAVYVVRR